MKSTATPIAATALFISFILAIGLQMAFDENARLQKQIDDLRAATKEGFQLIQDHHNRN